LSLTIIGLTAGALFGATIASILVAARAASDDYPTETDDWLSPGSPDTTRGEPQAATGSQEADILRLETGAERTPGSEDQPADPPTCEDSRSGPRVEPTASRPTPTNPPGRDRRNPSVGWARLRHHGPCSTRRKEQWSWG
jgi:hypothetical protein